MWLATNQLRTLVALDLEGIGVEKARVALHDGYVVPAQLRLDHFNLARHDRFRPENQVGHRDPVFQHIAAAVKGALPEAAEIQDRFPQSLAGDSAGVNADPANALLPVNDRHFFAHLGGADGAFLARRTAADHHQVVFVGFHKRGKLPLPASETKAKCGFVTIY